MVQVPGPRIVTVVPETLQMPGVLVVNVTRRPELAVALMVNGGALEGLSGSGANEMVWFACTTVKVTVTVAAAAYVVLPGWSAAIVQAPPARIVTVEPETVHTESVSDE